MATTLIATILSGLIVLASFGLARMALKRKKHVQTGADAAGVLFALSLFVFVDSLLQLTQGLSFFSSLGNGAAGMVGVIFLIGMLQGIAYEYVGQFTFPLWHYPSVDKRRWLLLGLPLFWGIFMFIMQDTWALLRGWGLDGWLAFILTALIHYALIEGFNLIGHSWRYKGWARTPWFLIPGWLLLALTFVLITNALVGSPFGL